MAVGQRDLISAITLSGRKNLANDFQHFRGDCKLYSAAIQSIRKPRQTGTPPVAESHLHRIDRPPCSTSTVSKAKCPPRIAPPLERDSGVV